MMVMELKDLIRQDIKAKVGKFVEEHPDVSVRFEYSESRRRFFISYHFDTPMREDDSIWDDVDEMEDYFFQKFHDDAPLFCEDDMLFTLSPAAEKIVAVKTDSLLSMRVAMATPSVHSKTVRLHK